jgi:mRNA-degrading endonuclease toxin of MazEF toxin-antitoxin module
VNLEGLPGNVRLERSLTRLSKTSVANVYDIQKVFRSDFVQSLGRLPGESIQRIDDGLRLVLEL